MTFYRYFGRIYGETIVGIVCAKNKEEAKLILKDKYEDYDLWTGKTLEKVDFKDNVYEVYYGY